MEDLVFGHGLVQIEEGLGDGGGGGEGDGILFREAEGTVGFDEFAGGFRLDPGFLILEESGQDFQLPVGGWTGGAMFEGVRDGGVKDAVSEGDGELDGHRFIEGHEGLERGRGNGASDTGGIAGGRVESGKHGIGHAAEAEGVERAAIALGIGLGEPDLGTV